MWWDKPCLSTGDELAGERMFTSSDRCPLLPQLPEQAEQPLEKEKKRISGPAYFYSS